LDVICLNWARRFTEGTVANCTKKVGDTVKADEPLFEVETDR